MNYIVHGSKNENYGKIKRCHSFQISLQSKFILLQTYFISDNEVNVHFSMDFCFKKVALKWHIFTQINEP